MNNHCVNSICLVVISKVSFVFSIILFLFLFIVYNQYYVFNFDEAPIYFNRCSAGNVQEAVALRHNFTLVNDSYRPRFAKAFMLATATDVLRKADKNLGREGYLILAVVNWGFRDFALNWIASMLMHGYSKFLCICLDRVLYAYLIEQGLDKHAALVPNDWLQERIRSSEVTWNTEAYTGLTRQKFLIAYEFLKQKYTILFTDVDLVWLSPNVVQYLHYVAEPYNFAIAQDGHENACIGFYLARPTTVVLDIFNTTTQLMKKNDLLEQVAVNKAINDILKIRYSKYLLYLDPLLFPNGKVFLWEKWNFQLKIKPLIFHANWLVGSKDKRNALKSNSMWYI